VETYDLAELVIEQRSQTWNLVFSRAKLVIVSDHGTRLWYVDVDGLTDEELLRRFSESDRIEVGMRTTTIGGRRLEGDGFLHPNLKHRAAAIRGDGPLKGYEE